MEPLRSATGPTPPRESALSTHTESFLRCSSAAPTVVLAWEDMRVLLSLAFGYNLR